MRSPSFRVGDIEFPTTLYISFAHEGEETSRAVSVHVMIVLVSCLFIIIPHYMNCLNG